MQKNKWYVSSTGEGISLTLKGAIVALVPTIVLIANYFGADLTTNAILADIEVIWTGIAALMIIIGFLRKVYYWITKRL